MDYKDLVIILKHGGTTSEIMEKFGFSTEEALIKNIKKRIPGQAEELIRHMKRNDKRLRQLSHSMHMQSETTVELLDNDSEQPIIELTNKVVDESEEAPHDEIEENSSISEMEQLLKDEVEISNLLCNLESEHKALVSKRRDIANILATKKTELEELLIKINQCEEEVATHCAQYNELKVQMTIVNNKIVDYKDFLSAVKERIEVLKQVLILVTSTDIEVENAVIPFVKPEEFSSKFTELLTHEEVEILTVKEIKTVATLLLIVKEFENYEIVFENEKMENIFKQFNTVS